MGPIEAGGRGVKPVPPIGTRRPSPAKCVCAAAARPSSTRRRIARRRQLSEDAWAGGCLSGCFLSESPRLLRPCCDSGLPAADDPWRRLCLLDLSLTVDNDAGSIRRRRFPPGSPDSDLTGRFRPPPPSKCIDGPKIVGADAMRRRAQRGKRADAAMEVRRAGSIVDNLAVQLDRHAGGVNRRRRPPAVVVSTSQTAPTRRAVL